MRKRQIEEAGRVVPSERNKHLNKGRVHVTSGRVMAEWERKMIIGHKNLLDT